MARKLREKEIPLVSAVFAKAGLDLSDSIRVEDMNDGGMGSLLFRRGASIAKFSVAEVFFSDEDGVLVSVTLNTTAEDQPVELDVWKVDFTPLKRWPVEKDILDSPPEPKPS